LAVNIKVEYSLALKEDRMLQIIFYIQWRRNDRMKCFIMYANLQIIYGDIGTVKCYIWSIALYGVETWTLRAVD